MKFKSIFLPLLLSLIFSSAYGNPINNMVILGEGQAYYLKFIKVYDATLYIERPATEEEVLQGTVSKCLFLDYDVSLKQEDFIKAADTVLARQFSIEQLNEVRDEIDLLHAAYRDVKDGDNYTLCYDRRENSTALSHNGHEIVRIVSQSFAQTYFSIWIGEKSPLDNKLRDNLLARD